MLIPLTSAMSTSYSHLGLSETVCLATRIISRLVGYVRIVWATAMRERPHHKIYCCNHANYNNSSQQKLQQLVGCRVVVEMCTWQKAGQPNN